MKHLHKNIFSSLFLLVCVSVFAQEPSFYIRSLRSISMTHDTLQMQPITFKEVDIVYNKIINFTDNKITIATPGKYEINGFVNINPGVYGTSKDSIQIEVYLIKNQGKPNEQLLNTARHNYTYGNMDVSRSFLFRPQAFFFQTGDEISIWSKVLPSSTKPINNNKNYHQIIKPSGMQQIVGLRISQEN